MTSSRPAAELTGGARSATTNHVQLSGRLAAAPEQRTLPSGDTLTLFRLIVARPPVPRGAAAAPRRPSVDTFDCVAWPAALQRRVRSLRPDEPVAVDGVLRRRFWRAAGAPASRVEVEISALRRLRRGAPDG